MHLANCGRDRRLRAARTFAGGLFQAISPATSGSVAARGAALRGRSARVVA